MLQPSCALFALLFASVSAQQYNDYYYYPTWPIYTAVILVFSIIVSIIGACCRRRAILQRQQRLQAALAAQQAAVAAQYPAGAYPTGPYPPGTYPLPPSAYPQQSFPPGIYTTTMPAGGPSASLPPYPVASAIPMDGFSNMGYAQNSDQDMFKPPPYSPSGFPEQSKPSGVYGAGSTTQIDVPPPGYDQAMGPASCQAPAAAAQPQPTMVSQRMQQSPQQRQL